MKKFLVEHLDHQAQGVSKAEEKILFLSKVLPGEAGSYELLHEKSKVKFGKLEELDEVSPKRIEPECIHFNECHGCHYLHTTYEHEIELKLSSYQRLFQRLIPETNARIIISKRFNYRNRIQLHYSKKQKKLGFLKPYSDQIIEVSSCLLPTGPIKEKLAELYENQKWMGLVSQAKAKGHLEIYGNGEVTLNSHYASEGFSQVNESVNLEMKSELKKFSEQLMGENILELFGGGGNLTRELAGKIDVIDSFPHKVSGAHQSFSQMNLYQKKAHLKLREKLAKNYDWLILDPPRSGLKNLNEWIESFSPSHITYISCDPMTQVRDLKGILDAYELKEVMFFDMFPGTYHLESMVHLEKKTL